METRLIDGLNLKNTVFYPNLEVEMKTYKYGDKYIEQISMEDLLDSSYLKKLMKYLNTLNGEYDWISISHLSKLLMMRIEQLQDSDAFYVLSKISEDEYLASQGVGFYDGIISELFLRNPSFFINSSFRYENNVIMKYVVEDFEMFSISEEKFYDRGVGKFTIQSEQVLIQKDFFYDSPYLANSEMKRRITASPEITIFMNPSSDNDWKGANFYFYDIRKPIREYLKSELNDEVYKYYMTNIDPLFDTIEIKNYHVKDSDGYVNVRDKADINSAVLGTVDNGKYVCYMGVIKNGWVKIYSPGLIGYIHQSRLVRE